MDATERRSSSTGRPPLRLGIQDDEKSDEANALLIPPEGRVSEPERRRLFRSPKAEEATDEATEVE